ncbi:isovaleryl-CoA dehydrogenase [Microvirga terrae]|uniref:Isovaleryl-CoA dehydrogenase n=1 Tax=Microvirga terrae TaxID=2740529 RepID=A0ABY5S0L5_9HYPH|nr:MULTISPECIES: isovaleryl-CoA dehydrogenase [Microvirga]MBQ0824384.1 isovaleryl-CoA dehydrogenase [Microvirga sp. HBU67558]UVF21819.1 isovaleryl-CoA dehydrogenase [Microvirga terrae]
MHAFETHDVLNQPPPFSDVNLIAANQPLLDALKASGLDTEGERLLEFGGTWGSAERLDIGRLANENPPKLRTHDSRGYRIDAVEFHPAYHLLMRASMEDGLHASTWDEPGTSHAHVARAARLYTAAGVESGHVCPITMTHASVGALAASPNRLAEWLPKIRSRVYDSRFIPFWEKDAVTLGMGMTEKQGGTDVRANTTRAAPKAGDEYELTGHKWFMSAPMCDAFLMLAQAPGGLTCFLVPRFRPDGSLNALRLQRLKDKLGNRSNASSEVEFREAFGWRIGEEGRGVRTIIEMVQLTRLDCAVASAGLIRMGLALAAHHVRHRKVFQKRLIDQPAMRMVLADLALESEAMTALALRAAGSFDLQQADGHEAAFARVVTPAAKFGICKAAPRLLYEAMECLGGNGYVEESALSRLYREAPVNAIWEGSGNVIALDILRAENREPEVAASVLERLMNDAGDLPGASDAARDIVLALQSTDPEAKARFVAERLFVLAAAAALTRSAPSQIVEAYALTRLAAPSRTIGANDIGGAANPLLERAFVAI